MLSSAPLGVGASAMPAERAARELTAIMLADIVGYSRLVAADEAGTLARSRSCAPSCSIR